MLLFLSLVGVLSQTTKYYYNAEGKRILNFHNQPKKKKEFKRNHAAFPQAYWPISNREINRWSM